MFAYEMLGFKLFTSLFYEDFGSTFGIERESTVLYHGGSPGINICRIHITEKC